VVAGLVGTAIWLILGARRTAPPPAPVAAPAPPPPQAPPPLAIARLTLPASAIAGVTVAIDGGPPQPLSQDLVLQLPPGAHRLSYAAPGHRGVEVAVMVVAGEERRLAPPALVAEPPRPRRRPAPPPPPEPAPPPPEPAPVEEPPPPPPPPVQRGELVEPGPGVVAPRTIRIPGARYPPLAQRQRQEAMVLVSVLVDENGTVIEARVDQGGPPGYGFDEAALEAARASSFHPATKDGVEVKMWKQIRLGFRVR
jgi:protein TonB